MSCGLHKNEYFYGLSVPVLHVYIYRRHLKKKYDIRI